MKFIDSEQEVVTNFCFITRSSLVTEFLYDTNLATKFYKCSRRKQEFRSELCAQV